MEKLIKTLIKIALIAILTLLIKNTAFSQYIVESTDYDKSAESLEIKVCKNNAELHAYSSQLSEDKTFKIIDLSIYNWQPLIYIDVKYNNDKVEDVYYLFIDNLEYVERYFCYIDYIIVTGDTTGIQLTYPSAWLSLYTLETEEDELQFFNNKEDVLFHISENEYKTSKIQKYEFCVPARDYYKYRRIMLVRTNDNFLYVCTKHTDIDNKLENIIALDLETLNYDVLTVK